jgi:hypothetical protein
MAELTLQQRLAAYLKKRPNQLVAKGTLEDKARAIMGVTAETVGRRLRVLHEATCIEETTRKTPEHVSAWKLAEGGRFEVEHIGNHSHYVYRPPRQRQVRRVVVEGGIAREIIETIEL